MMLKIAKNEEDSNIFAINMLEYVNKIEIECLM